MSNNGENTWDPPKGVSGVSQRTVIPKIRKKKRKVTRAAYPNLWGGNLGGSYTGVHSRKMEKKELLGKRARASDECSSKKSSVESRKTSPTEVITD